MLSTCQFCLSTKIFFASMTASLINDLLIVLAAGLFAGLVCRWLKGSVLVGYLVVGTLLGKGVLGWVQDEGHQLEYYAEAGVFLLLFSIGIEFSLDDLKRLGKNLIIGGLTQMLLVAIPVLAVLMYFKMELQSAVLIAAAISFSSTVLVFKTLSQWGQSQRPHGRRAIGILLFQDAALVPLLLLIPLLTDSGEQVSVWNYLMLALTSGLFVAAVLGIRYLLAHKVIPLLAGYRNPELVILFTIVLLGAVTLVAHSVGLPPAVGAFAAGLIFNGNRWTKQIDALVLPFRETFSAVFFISLGLILDPMLFVEHPLQMLGSLFFVVLLKAFAATIALKLTGMKWRSSLGMGIGLAHVGEFAFVLVLIGVEAGVLGEFDYQRVVGIAVGSLVLTPFLMKLGMRLLHDDEMTDEVFREEDTEISGSQRATVIGAGPIGSRITSQLETIGKDVCLIDLSPINLHPFAQEGFRTITGDATDADILKLAEVEQSSIVVVSVPDDVIAVQVVKAVRGVNSECRLIVRCRYHLNAAKLIKFGADRVVSEEVEASMALLRELNLLSRSS